MAFEPMNAVGHAPHRGEASDRLWTGVLLDELRQTAIRYTEAALEASSPDVRRVFEQLAYDTVRRHEQLTGIAQQNRLLDPAFAAPVHEVGRVAARAAEAQRAVAQMTAGFGRPSPETGAAPTSPTSPKSPAYAAPPQPSAPRWPSYSTYLNMQQARPPEFALPHQLPFGGAPAGHYTPPQPQPRPAPAFAESSRRASSSELSYPAPTNAQPAAPALASSAADEERAFPEALPPMRDPEPARSSAVREEASVEAREAGTAGQPEPSAQDAPSAPQPTATKRSRRAKASAAEAAAAADATEERPSL
ncbi:spore coat protein [Paenibacillus sp.]|uniref:spore coat protein n=1 Tax=Paenibacillus sp. TaxID=58172 RepID=UPI002D6F0762|nr:spore coat protein [Paenibacillus sp.]HZG56132.1 spore coat protein [Paenibacillus sp.]